MNVAAIIVTKGDQDITPVLVSLLSADFSEVLIWDNSGEVTVVIDDEPRIRWLNHGGRDLSVYGRYAAIEYTDADLIYVQDDDCVVSDPQAIVRDWKRVWREGIQGKDGVLNLHSTGTDAHVVCNMPQEFRHEFYSDHALVGFGACFHRAAPGRAFWVLGENFNETAPWVDFNMDWFHRTCDIVFTALTPRVLVDVPYENLPWAHYYDRMWRQPEHQAERARMLDLVRQVRAPSPS